MHSPKIHQDACQKQHKSVNLIFVENPQAFVDLVEKWTHRKCAPINTPIPKIVPPTFSACPMRCLRGGFFFSVTISPACWTTIAFSAGISAWQAERFVWAVLYWPMRSSRGHAAT